MIKVLSKETIDKIAAGEVVEKPQNVVKELVDNSLDSGASAISIEVRGGGTTLIRVTDNGCGIEKDDLKTAFLRHATSKITSADDLSGIRTMGFRGEALSSISAVSRVEVLTKRKNTLYGYRYTAEAGSQEKIEEIGIPDGTTVLVRDLFFNIPVRRDFLKSERVETAAIRDTVEKFALGSPDVSFTLTVDGKQVLHTSGNGKLKDVIYLVYGADLARELIFTDQSGEGIRICGYISKPSVSRSRREYEVFYVNGRHISDKNLSEALETAYEPYLMQHRFPFAVLSLTIDPSCIDVNIHPKKEEIRFSDTESVCRALYRTVSETLSGKDLIPDVKIPEKEKTEAAVQTKIYHAEPFERAFSERIAEKKPEPAAMRTDPEPVIPAEALAEEPPAEKISCPAYEQLRFTDVKAKPYYRYLGQYANTYILIEYSDCLYMIDQHAAHEKVLYERFSKQIRENVNASPASQEIIPYLLELPASLSVLSFEDIAILNSIGFELEEAGGCDLTVRAVPAALPALKERELLLDLIEQMASESNLPKNPELIKERVASMACKAAVKAGMRLSDPEIRALIDELLLLDDPFNCPHGRPVIVRFTRYDIDKMFKRIV